MRVGTELILQDNSHGYTDFHSQTPSVETDIEKPEVVRTDYVIDYTRLGVDQRVLMKSEEGGYDFRYTYGREKLKVFTTGEGSNWWGQNVKQCVNAAYVHTDLLGSVVNLSDQYGRVTARTDYTDWGEVRRSTDITVNGGFRRLLPEITYATHEYDDVLNQFYAKARMYDAENKRFTAMDPAKGEVTKPMSMTQYLYVLNNALAFVDLLGKVRLNNQELVGAITGRDLGQRRASAYLYADELKMYLMASGVRVMENTQCTPYMRTGGYQSNGKTYYRFEVVKDGRTYVRVMEAAVGTVRVANSRGQYTKQKAYFLPLACVRNMAESWGLNWNFSETSKMFRKADYTEKRGTDLAYQTILDRFLNGGATVYNGHKRNINYFNCSYLGSYMIQAYLRADAAQNDPTFAENAAIVAGAALQAQLAIAAYPEIMLSGPLPAGAAFGALFIYNLWAAEQDGVMPSGTTGAEAFAEAFATFAPEEGKVIDEWFKEELVNNAEEAAEKLMAFLDSDYLFLLKDTQAAGAFANDLSSLRDTHLNSGAVGLFGEYISDYARAYRGVTQAVIGQNRNLAQSKKSMEAYINGNYLNYKGALSQDAILAWKFR